MKGLYKFLYFLTLIFVSIVYRIKVTGRENIPDGPVIICGNHSSNLDPLFLAYAMKSKNHVHFMAKAELFKIPVVGALLKSSGIFPVARDKADVNAVKTTMKYLKNGEKVGIFPEGKRVADESNTKAKSGAITMAVRADVPVLPVYIAREKKWYRRIPIVIGEPYHVPLAKKGSTAEDYERETVALMEKINSLRTVQR